MVDRDTVEGASFGSEFRQSLKLLHFLSQNDLITYLGYPLVFKMNLILSSSDGYLSGEQWQEPGELWSELCRLKDGLAFLLTERIPA